IVDQWRDLIRRVCTDSLMIPMDKTRAELAVDVGEPSAASRHTDVFAPVWHVAKMVSTLRIELAGYRTAERLMRSHSHGETTAAPRDPEPSVHSERQRSRSPRRGRAPSARSHR
ncbi:hypothetical protein KI387_015049, partial [Taxus chinensis]